jgi:hypothetical protein
MPRGRARVIRHDHDGKESADRTSKQRLKTEASEVKPKKVRSESSKESLQHSSTWGGKSLSEPPPGPSSQTSAEKFLKYFRAESPHSPEAGDPRGSESDMAAAVIAARKGSRIPLISQDAETVVLRRPQTNQTLREGNAHRLIIMGGCLDWRETYLAMTDDFLGFGKVGESTLVEYIPLEDIIDVKRHKADAILGDGYVKEDTQAQSPTVNDDPARLRETKSYAKAKSFFNKTSTTADILQIELDASSSDEEREETECFRVETSSTGRNGGRSYTFKIQGQQMWVRCLREAIRKKKDLLARSRQLSRWQQTREHARKLHQNENFQRASGIIVMISFILSCAEAEARAEPGSHLEETFETIELSFTCIYCIESIIAIVAYWCPLSRAPKP